MKIAIPAENKSLSSNVYESFGRAPYFLFHNTITKESEFLDNSAVISQGAAGIRVAQVIADNGIKALITPRCGENAQKILKNAEVFVYKSIPGTLQENIDEFLSDKLTLISEFHSSFHGQKDN
ncbi:MAG: NifB/NifX family molybdenum-iron cluster-binding protein [Poseidonibacter sp.]|uniref:NifB/NifX family molybdenum-iron cluster-binding protein n=1 Tax=Poseidonibacter sp. TaxID=2321188 RepID=UPI00359D7EA2